MPLIPREKSSQIYPCLEPFRSISSASAGALSTHSAAVLQASLANTRIVGFQPLCSAGLGSTSSAQCLAVLLFESPGSPLLSPVLASQPAQPSPAQPFPPAGALLHTHDRSELGLSPAGPLSTVQSPVASPLPPASPYEVGMELLRALDLNKRGRQHSEAASGVAKLSSPS